MALDNSCKVYLFGNVGRLGGAVTQGSAKPRRRVRLPQVPPIIMQEPVLLAGCIVLDDYGRILLVHRYDGDGHWELPGGKVEEGEEPIETAIREFREEVGVVVDITRAVGEGEFEKDGEAYKYFWFQATIVAGEPQVMETDKFDDLDYFELEDLPSLALSQGMLTLEAMLVHGEAQLEQ